MKNIEIKTKIKESRIMQYEIAAKIGISEYTLCRWFRKELTSEQRMQILDAIAAIKACEVHEEGREYDTGRAERDLG